MGYKFNDKKPIYLQIKERLADQIVNEQLEEDEQIPSTTEMVNFYQVNHITISKGVNILVDQGIIYKKRGIGMFVAPGAKEKLLEKRRGEFIDKYIIPMLKEAEKLDIEDNKLTELIKKAKERINDGS